MSQLQISPEILNGLTNVAKQKKLSINDLLEQIIQGKLTLIDADELEDLLDLNDAIKAEADSANQERISLEAVKQELGL